MGTETMYDSVNVAAIPTSATKIAVYVSGHEGVVSDDVIAEMRARGLKVVTIDVDGTRLDADVADVERGDLKPEDFPAWVDNHHGLNVPTAYCNQSTLPDVVAACGPDRLWDRWVADWPGLNMAVAPHILAGTMSTQYASFSGFDVSLTEDIWPRQKATSIVSESVQTDTPSEERLNAPVVAVVIPARGGGYWLVCADGGVFSFGTAIPFASNPLPSRKLAGSIVGAVSSPTGQGLLLVGSDGGVFALGDAEMNGSIPGLNIGPAE